MTTFVKKEPVETTRIYFERNRWRTIPFSDMRGVLGLSHEDANHALKVLMDEGFITKVAHGKYRCEPHSRKESSHEENGATTMNGVTAAQTASFDDAVGDEEVPGIPAYIGAPQAFPSDVGKLLPPPGSIVRSNGVFAMGQVQADAIFEEAFTVLRELSPMGATLEELHELIGRKGRYEMLSRKFKEVTDAGYVRTERAPGVKNRGRGFVVKRFWVADPPGGKMNGSIPVSPVASFEFESPQVSMPAPSPPPPVESSIRPLVVNNNAPTGVLTAVGNFNARFVDVLKERVAELDLLLASIEPLLEEKRHLEEVLKMHER